MVLTLGKTLGDTRRGVDKNIKIITFSYYNFVMEWNGGHNGKGSVFRALVYKNFTVSFDVAFSCRSLGKHFMKIMYVSNYHAQVTFNSKR